MLYYIGIALRDAFGPLNVLTYNTVRAGGAAFTGFIISLIIGPLVIRWLQALKVGQFIRQKHVADLHALHQKKEGTPTMGGALIIIATVLSLCLWGRFDNRLLLIALSVFVVLGLVGFIDDYIKLRRKQNEGLSAKAKFTGQILVGLALGLYLTFNSITPPRLLVTRADIQDWPAAVEILVGYSEKADAIPRRAGSMDEQNEIVQGLNELVRDADLYALGGHETGDFMNSARVLARKYPNLTKHETQLLNRFILDGLYPDVIKGTPPMLHQKLEIPFLKEAFIPLGIGYSLFVLLIIVCSSNAVNLTDGLDGLAIGASVISIMAYTAIAYIVSRADWASYLYLVYVPEASELTVFGAALLGTGLGFLWFNSHPAEVFMGDTGSLALGGAIGAMAVLTKQELLLVLVGGLFVIEAGSVVLQVASYKTRGKRIFRMAPLHHHFELKGWSETKVVIRFWIMAIVFALMSLGALKLR